VALSIVEHEDPYRTAQQRGRVVATRTGDEAWDLPDAIARRYTGADYPERVGVLYEVDWEAFTDLSMRRAPGR
jgi:hypothetical protein